MRTFCGTKADLPPGMEAELARYRHAIFIEWLKWPLMARDGMESDQFDREDTVYVVGLNRDGMVSACARLLPTTRPYLLAEVFPDLIDGVLPHASTIWELSRFSTWPGAQYSAPDVQGSRKLLAAAVEAARIRGAERLITVSPLGVERLLRRMGVNASRAGKPSRINGKPVYASWIEIDAQTLHALGLRSAQRGRRP